MASFRTLVNIIFSLVARRALDFLLRAHICVFFFCILVALSRSSHLFVAWVLACLTDNDNNNHIITCLDDFFFSRISNAQFSDFSVVRENKEEFRFEKLVRFLFLTCSATKQNSSWRMLEELMVLVVVVVDTCSFTFVCFYLLSASSWTTTMREWMWEKRLIRCW